MQYQEEPSSGIVSGVLTPFTTLTLLTSLAAIVGTFVLSTSSLETGSKALGFTAIVVLYLGLWLVGHFRERERSRTLATSETLDRELAVLDDVTEYFAHNLVPAEAFRLAAGRIKKIVRYSSAALYLQNPERTGLILVEFDGPKDHSPTDEGNLSTECLETGNLIIDEASMSAAIPLKRGEDTFGVLLLETVEVDETTCEAIGSRLSVLLLSSMAFERGRDKALMDPTTQLPNERGFYLLLENQIAEAVRKRAGRPLSVLAMDVKGFDEINARLGHVAGDAVLAYVAEIGRENVRQMDVFARSHDDEFLAILPTASKEISSEIIARIQTGFFGRRFKLNDGESLEIEVNFGWAAFGEDGETASELVEVARVRKDRAKYAVTDNVVSFSKELAN
jgi:diguanylate cyclase (GGDEF)-like protein